MNGEVGWWVGLGLGFFLGSCGTAAGFPGVVDLELAGPDGRSRWEATHAVARVVGLEGGGLRLEAAGEDPFITSPVLTNLPAGELVLEMRVRADQAGWGQVFWHRGAAREEDSAHFEVGPGRWTDVSLALPALGDGSRLRLDGPGSTGAMEVAWVRLGRVGALGVTGVVARGGELEVTYDGGGREVALVEVGPEVEFAGVDSGVVVARPGVTGIGRFLLPRVDPGTGRDRLTSGFHLRELGGREVRPMGVVRRVERFEGVPRLRPARVVPRSKKGLQVQMVDDALALGIGHAALNVNLPALWSKEGGDGTYRWRSGGRDFHFRKSAVDGIPVKALSDAGVAVSLILLAYASGDGDLDRLWLSPGYDTRAPNRLGAFNTRTPAGVEAYRATLEFLADRFSQEDGRHGRVSHLIVGNEVTAHWHWANMGEVPADVFIRDYERVVRLTHATVRGVTDTIGVCLSLDHHWNIVYEGRPLRAIAGRRLLDEFNRVARMGGNFGWDLAYHPYPENLFRARTWEDRTALPGPDTPRITFRNLEVLTRYMEGGEYRLEGRVRRVLLTEQGFHSDGTEAGERLQAAAYAYAWKKVQANAGIEAFILHRHVDHGQEGGLNLGLWRRRGGTVSEPEGRKPIYEVFRAAGTPGEEAAFRFALEVIGIRSWDEIAR